MTAREECTCIKLPGGGRLPIDDCPKHSKGGGQNGSDECAPDVAEPRSVCNCKPHDNGWRDWDVRCPQHGYGSRFVEGFAIPCDDPDAPGPTVLPDTIDLYAPGPSDVDRMLDAELIRRYRDALAEIERLRSYLKDKERGGIEKLKHIQRLEAENTKLRETLERLDDELSEPLWLDVALPRLRKMIANALATETLEGK